MCFLGEKLYVRIKTSRMLKYVGIIGEGGESVSLLTGKVNGSAISTPRIFTL